MVKLPVEFQERMKELLGAEYDDFLRSYEEPRRYGLRVNTAKISVEEFRRMAPFRLTPVPWAPNGFYYEEADQPARHAFYYAGLYYVQEPSAMAPAAILAAEPGERVLDLCAAPGGKATELGAGLRGEGLLAANDISASRAKALQKNIEVFGIPNSLLLNETPGHIAEQFPEYFDKILVDAPCSGEGMFRKEPEVARAWTPEKPAVCAKQQKEIILAAERMLRPGGMMLYSTCTFAPEEDEQVIRFLLEKCPGLRLVPIRPAAACWTAPPGSAVDRPVACWTTAPGSAVDRPAACWTAASGAGEPPSAAPLSAPGQSGDTSAAAQMFSPGRPEWAPDEDGNLREELTLCARIWPHKQPGEGHFLALLKKASEEPGSAGAAAGAAPRAFCTGRQNGSKENRTDRQPRPAIQGSGREKSGGSSARPAGKISREEQAILDEFFRDVRMLLDWNRVEVRKGQAYYVPEGLPPRLSLNFLRNGLYLGELKKDRFEPSQSLAMALKKNEYASLVNLSRTDERVFRYLRGETIPVDDVPVARPKGWQLVCVDGYPLGWGKLSGGLLKNKYLAGWRMK